MWTVILSFLKNPKNLIIVILAILVLTCGTVVLFQRGSIAKASAKVALQSAEIERYKAVQKAYIDLIDDYTTQIVKLQKLNESHQAVSNATAKVVTKIKYIKSDCKLGGQDAEIVNSTFEYFNTGKLRE